MYKMPSGPAVYSDIDDTIVCWGRPTQEDRDLGRRIVTIERDGIPTEFVINEHNLEHLLKLAQRFHQVILYSAGGADWCEAVAKALKIEPYVFACLSKPTYYMDDVFDPKDFMGKHVFYDMQGKRHGYAPKQVIEKEGKSE